MSTYKNQWTQGALVKQGNPSESIFNIEHPAVELDIPAGQDFFDIADFFKNMFPKKEAQMPQKPADMTFLSPRENLPFKNFAELTKPDAPVIAEVQKPAIIQQNEQKKRLEEARFENEKKLREAQKCKFIKILYANINEYRDDDDNRTRARKLTKTCLELNIEDNFLLENLDVRVVANPNEPVSEQYGEIDEKKFLQMKTYQIEKLPKPAQERFFQIKEFIVQSTIKDNEGVYFDDNTRNEAKLTQEEFKIMVEKGIWYGEKGSMAEDCSALKEFLKTPEKDLTETEAGLIEKIKSVS